MKNYIWTDITMVCKKMGFDNYEGLMSYSFDTLNAWIRTMEAVNLDIIHVKKTIMIYKLSLKLLYRAIAEKKKYIHIQERKTNPIDVLKNETSQKSNPLTKEDIEMSYEEAKLLLYRTGREVGGKIVYDAQKLMPKEWGLERKRRMDEIRELLHGTHYYHLIEDKDIDKITKIIQGLKGHVAKYKKNIKNANVDESIIERYTRMLERKKRNVQGLIKLWHYIYDYDGKRDSDRKVYR